jgi:D-alanyl-D-alanine carboxypeptidase/D-alanyl-D-alanine-endopeptidase (penicillin-binding protein 4)
MSTLPAARRTLSALVACAALLTTAATTGTATASAAPLAPQVLRPQLTAASVAQDLRTRLHEALATSTASQASVAVDVAGLGAVYRSSATTALPPASTEKLFTSLAALQAIGPATRLFTQLRATSAQRGTSLPGDLYLVGGGDPYLTTAQLDALAAAVRAAGIRKVEGSLVVDDLRYDAVRRAPGWKTSYVPDESGPLSALAVDRNGWRTDAAYLADPGLPTLDRFRSLLAKHGVATSPGLHRGAAPVDARVLASHPSAPLAALLRRTDKASDNFAAELLLKELGRAVRGVGSTAAGAAAARDVLVPLRVSVGTVSDGSGLSSRDRQTAFGELSLLKAAEASTSASALRQALPIACTDGTLLKRMCGTAAAGVAVAKTGSLPGVTALTGWTTTADGQAVRFAFQLSGASSTSKARAALDRCVALLSAVRTTG